MRKVLISFIGTTDYQKCEYYFEGRKTAETCFVQEAIFELFCKDFTNNDAIYIFVTDKARELNWTPVDSSRLSLKLTFDRLAEQAKNEGRSFPKVEAISITEEQNEKGIWQLFEKITNQIKEGDELYFDTTNAFRSLSVISTSVLNYLKFTKNITISGVYYSFLDSQKKKAQLYDIHSMIEIFDWANGVETYIRTGEAALLKQTVANQKEGKNIPNVYVSLVEALDDVSEVFATCRGKRLKESLSDVHRLLLEAKAIQSDELKPLQNLFAIIEQKIEKINYENDYILSLDVAAWCIEHSLIQQAVTFLREGINTVICIGLGVDSTKYKYRELAWDIFYRYSEGLSIKKKDFIKRVQQFDLRNANDPITVEVFETIYRKIEEMEPLLKRLFSERNVLLFEITNVRNDVNHASMTKKGQKIYKDKEEIVQTLNGIISHLRTFYEEVQLQFEIEEAQR